MIKEMEWGMKARKKCLYLNKTNNINNEETETNMHFYSSVIAWIHFVLHHGF